MRISDWSSDVCSSDLVASIVSAHPLVRAALLQRQRRFARQPGGAVLDGRDIGTVIAPEAEVKLFVKATPTIRARRRHAELQAHGGTQSFDRRSEERGVGKEWVSTFRSGWSPHHSKKKAY